MIRWLSILLLLWCGCARKTPDSRYRTAERLFKKGELPQALAEVDAGLRAEPSWRFRLLKAEILLSKGKGPGAAAILASGEPPVSAEIRARRKMFQGGAMILLSDYPAAEVLLQEASDLAKPLGLPLLQAEIELRQGFVDLRTGRNEQADRLLRQVLETATTHSDLRLQASAMGNLGLLFQITNQYEEAIHWLDRARSVFEQLGAADSLAKTIGNLGWCYSVLGDYDKALDYLRRAEAHFRASGNRYEQQIWLGNLASVLQDQGDAAEALPKFRGALAIARDLQDRYYAGLWLNDLADAAILLGDFDAAERYNDEAIRSQQGVRDQSRYYPQLNQARIARGRKQLARAEELYRALLAEPVKDPAPMLEAEADLAGLLAEEGQLDRADAQFRIAIQRIENQRAGLAREEHRLSYFASLTHFYDDYVDFLVACSQPERALEAAESGRARVLDERLESKEAAPSSATSARLRNLARSSHVVVLSYWLGKKRSFLWAVTPDSIALHVLPPEREIASLVESYRALVESLRDPLESEDPAGRKLSEILLGPVPSVLGSGLPVVVVPDRSLYSLNFETLPDPDDWSKYLISRTTVVIAPSLDLLTGQRPARPARHSMLLIGDPEQAVEEYPKLPFAAREMALIEQTVPGDSKVVMAGAQAYPGAYREATPGRFSWIHFAAHAAANRESPLDSALILSRRDSGYSLFARDVMNVPLNAELVTLSACRSAGARTYSGEGLVGLSWAFLRAGARSVVAGLWDVTDASTAMLMGDFYSHLSRGIAPAEALREAKLKLIRSSGAYRKPFYWGPFQLYAGALN